MKSFALKATYAIASGVMLTMAFPSAGIRHLAWVALVPLILSMNNASFGSGFRLGFISGVVHYLTLLYWLVPTMEIYGHLPIYLSVPLLILLSSYLAGYIGLFCGIGSWLSHRFRAAAAGFPVLWVSLEYARSTLFTGFPWELLGHSQYLGLHLIQLCDIFGVYGLSFLILASNTAISIGILYAIRISWFGKKISGKVTAASFVVSGCLLCASWVYGSKAIRETDRLVLESPSLRISVIQGNIEQALKWDPEFQLETIKRYVSLSREAGKDQPDLIVWPETATPFYFLKDLTLSLLVLQGIQEIENEFLIGSPSYSQDKSWTAYYNSAYLIHPREGVRGRYDKAHLVPYGEYIPLKKWFPFAGKMVEHVGDFEAGKTGAVLTWPKADLGPLICYEGIFPDLSRSMARNGAGILVNITNDAWYGRTSAPYQHFSMGVFRAVENRRALVRSANTGISGFIDPSGRIISETRLFEKAQVTETVPIIRKKTVYTRFGDWFAVGCAALALMGICMGLTRQSYRPKWKNT
ncbi:MAG: apolipoprotein N-acyltransferase [Thermodesulfobacteriota bacterium]